MLSYKKFVKSKYNKKKYPNFKKWLKENEEKLTYLYNTLRAKKKGKGNFYWEYWEYARPESIESDKIIDIANENSKFQIEEMIKHQLNKKDKFFKRMIKAEKENIYFKGDWIRYLEKDQYTNKKILKYSSLITLNYYLLDFSSEYFEKLLNKKIPSKTVYQQKEKIFNKEKNKSNKKIYKMNFGTTKRFGFENELEIIKKRWHTIYYYDVLKYINNISHKYQNYTYRINDFEKDYDNFNYDIIGENIVDKITINNFVDDIIRYEEPSEVLEFLKNKIKNKIKNILKKEIKRNNIKY